jgi:hypothetical protein
MIRTAYLSEMMRISDQMISETVPSSANPGAARTCGLDGFSEGIERTRADIAIDDAACAERCRGRQRRHVLGREWMEEGLATTCAWSSRVTQD